MVTWIVGDLLTGQRIQTVPVVSGTWTDTLNDAGTIACTVTLKDPAVRRLGLREAANPGKAFLAALDGDTVLQAGPVWLHDFDDDTGDLTLRGAGMWSYFDHRVLIPVLAGFLPTSPSADTVLTSSLQGIARALVMQAQSHTGGSVPIILPAPIAGSNERAYRGADLGIIGDRLRELAQVEGGPDIRFQGRLKADRTGIEWDMQIGTPTEPLLFSAVRPTFNVGLAGASTSRFRVEADGTRLASRGFASGGRSADKALVAVAEDPTLPAQGFPLLERVDSSRSTVVDPATLQNYAAELPTLGRRPLQTWSLTHDLAQRPFLSGFSVGDFATVRVRNNLYLDDRDYTMRIVSRSGDARGRKLDINFQPEVI